MSAIRVRMLKPSSRAFFVLNFLWKTLFWKSMVWELLLSALFLCPSGLVFCAEGAGEAKESAEKKASSDRESAGRGFLKEVVVTATRIGEENFSLPYTVHSLDEEELSVRKAVRTLPEALREIPGIMVQKTSYGQASPYIRGFTGFRTLLLIDGIRLNNAVFRDGPNQYWSTVDPLTVERLEVVKGSSSVLYGSDAVGGTVNVITRGRDPRSEGAGDRVFDWKRRGYYRYGSAESSHTVRGEVSAAFSDDVGVLGGISYRDFGLLSGGRGIGEMPYTAYDDLDGDFKGIVNLSPEAELVFAFQRVTEDDVPRTHSTVFSKSWRGTAVGSDLKREYFQRRTLGYTQFHWRPEDLSWLSKVTASLSYQLQEERENRVRGNGRERRQGFEDGTLGAWIQLDSPSPVGTLTYGIEYYRDFVDSFFKEYNSDGTVRSIRPRGPVADDASYDLLGVYVQDRVRPVEKLEVTVGGRFTYARAEADNVDPDPSSAPYFGSLDESFSGAVGSLRLLYEAFEEWHVFGGVSQGFRAPNLSDLTRFDTARSGEVETPAPDLDSERFTSFEIGSKFLLAEQALQCYVSYYYTIIDGMIIRFPTGNTIDGDPEVTKDNVGDGYVQGVELGLAWNFYEGLTCFLSAAWVEGEADTYVGTEKKRKPFSRIQPATALVGLRWEPKRSWWIEGTVMIADNQDRLSPRDASDTQRIPPGGTPGYTVYTLRGGVEVAGGINLFAGIENITDRDYRIHGSGQNEPGTNAVLGVDIRF